MAINRSLGYPHWSMEPLILKKKKVIKFQIEIKDEDFEDQGDSFQPYLRE
jgi:hypothetical protein